jgi:hypothetical protein
MKYLLLIHSNPANWAKLSETERGTLMKEYGEITEEIVKSGEFVSAAPLADVSTTGTVRVREGRRDVSDKAFVESPEALTGYYLIDVADLDRAREIAARIPDTRFGATEIRALCDTAGTDM